MLAAAQILLQGFYYLAILLLIAGMVRPVLVLWFLPQCNRWMVIKLYGSIALSTYLVQFLLRIYA
jgi:predicted membrane channel-forming protein YqfA (hemolysin III family)